MHTLDMTTKNLFLIIIEEVKAKPVLSWEGNILEVRKDGIVDCLYIKVNDELFKIIEMDGFSVEVTTTHRNKIPVYYRHIGNRHCISNSVYCLVHKNDTIVLDATSLAATLMNIGDPKSYFTNIFKDIRLLKSSSIYTIDNGDIKYKKNYYSQYFNNYSYTNRNDLIELLHHKYENLCKQYENIHLFLSAGYDSRLELALLVNSVKRYKNKMILYHYSEFGSEHDIVMSIAKDYKLELVVYDGSSLFQRGVVNLTGDADVLKYSSGPFQMGLYFALEAVNSIRKNKTKDNETDVFLVKNVGALKGRYYPPMRSLVHIDRERFASMRSRLDISITYDEYLCKRQNMLHDMTSSLEEVKDVYAKLDILYAMIIHSNLFGKRMHALMMMNNCVFPIDDDIVWLNFANLKNEDKEGSRFIKYTIHKLEKRLNNHTYISGNSYQFRNNMLSSCYKRLMSYILKFLNTKNAKIDRSELILSMIKNDDVRSEILWDIRNRLIDHTLTSSLYSLQTLKFLSLLEHDYNCSFTLM